MPQLAYVDGRILPLDRASVPVEDRGLQFGDAIYEVVAILNGRPLDWDGHMVRLRRNLKELAIDLPMSDAAFGLQARRLLALNGHKDAILYVQIGRGAAKRDHAFPVHARASLVMTVRRFDFVQRVRQLETGVSVITRPDQRWARVDIKTVGLLPNALAKQAAREAGAFEAWLVAANGTVREGSSTNAWMVKDGTVFTHPTGTSILPGIARDTLLKLARSAQIKVAEQPFSLDAARGADEAFLTSTTAPILPVVRIDGAAVADGRPGPITRRLAGLVWDEIHRQTGWAV
jgi:D-alanine transaminase